MGEYFILVLYIVQDHPQTMGGKYIYMLEGCELLAFELNM